MTSPDPTSSETLLAELRELTRCSNDAELSEWVQDHADFEFGLRPRPSDEHIEKMLVALVSSNPGISMSQAEQTTIVRQSCSLGRYRQVMMDLVSQKSLRIGPGFVLFAGDPQVSSASVTNAAS